MWVIPASQLCYTATLILHHLCHSQCHLWQELCLSEGVRYYSTIIPPCRCGKKVCVCELNCLFNTLALFSTATQEGEVFVQTSSEKAKSWENSFHTTRKCIQLILTHCQKITLFINLGTCINNARKKIVKSDTKKIGEVSKGEGNETL